MTAEQSLRIDGQLVADLTLRPPFGADSVHDVKLFHSSSGWTALVLTRRERHDDYDDGRLISATAQVWTRVVADVAALQAWVERQWNSSAWWQLVEAGHDRDPELYRVWVPQRVARDLDGSSLYPRDLAPGWDPVEAMATHLQGDGWDILATRPRVTARAERINRVLGGLVGRRYGWQAPIVVRADDTGEVYARLADRDEVRGPGLGELTDREREQHAERRSRARRWERDEDTRRGWQR